MAEEDCGWAMTLDPAKTDVDCLQAFCSTHDRDTCCKSTCSPLRAPWAHGILSVQGALACRTFLVSRRPPLTPCAVGNRCLSCTDPSTPCTLGTTPRGDESSEEQDKLLHLCRDLVRLSRSLQFYEPGGGRACATGRLARCLLCRQLLPPQPLSLPMAAEQVVLGELLSHLRRHSTCCTRLRNGGHGRCF